MRRGLAITAATLLLSGGVAACGGDSSSSSDTPAASTAAGAGGTTAAKDAVTIKTFQFSPVPLKVKAGTTVTFRNNDAILHTVTSGVRKGENQDTPDGKFDIALKTAGATGTERFDKPGTYPFFCKIHPGRGMTGEIVVE